MPYGQVTLWAILPAILYFTGIFIAVHLEAKKLGLKGIPRSELPNFWKLQRSVYLLLPLVILVWLVTANIRSLQFSASIAILIAIVVSLPGTVRDTRAEGKPGSVAVNTLKKTGSMTALGLFTLCVGGMGVLGGKNVLVLLVSIVFGTLAGTVINIDGRIDKLGKKVEARFSGNGTSGGLAQSFVTATLMMCVGAMAVVGSIKAGTTGDCTLLYTKSVMDLIASLMLAVSLGAGVPLSAVCVFVFEGAVTLLGGVLAPVLTETMSTEASDMSGWLLMGLPGVAYFTGLADATWTAIGLAVGTYLNWLFVAKRLRLYSSRIDAITIPDFFAKRYHDPKLIEGIAAIVVIVFFIPYTASGFAACGKLFTNLFSVNYMDRIAARERGRVNKNS